MLFTRTLNRIIQGAAVATVGLQAANQATGGNLLTFIPFPFNSYILLGLTVTQALAGLKAHNVNPDGTPASVPFIEDKK